jgi:hypothetical protein
MPKTFGVKDTKPIDELRQTVNDIAQAHMRNRLQVVQNERTKAESDAIGGVLKTYTEAIKGKPTSHTMLVPNQIGGMNFMGIQSSPQTMEVDPKVEERETVKAHNDLMAIGTPKAVQSAKGLVDMYKLTRDQDAKTEFQAYLKMYGGNYGAAIDAYRKARVADKAVSAKKVAQNLARANQVEKIKREMAGLEEEIELRHPGFKYKELKDAKNIPNTKMFKTIPDPYDPGHVITSPYEGPDESITKWFNLKGQLRAAGISDAGEPDAPGKMSLKAYRQQFGLSEDDYPDDYLKEYLEKNGITVDEE